MLALGGRGSISAEGCHQASHLHSGAGKVSGLTVAALSTLLIPPSEDKEACRLSFSFGKFLKLLNILFPSESYF